MNKNCCNCKHECDDVCTLFDELITTNGSCWMWNNDNKSD